MSHAKISSSGSSHDRRHQRRHSETGAVPDNRPENPTADSLGGKKQPDPERTQRRNDLLTLIGVALGCASWGWTVLAPESSVKFGSALLFAGVAIFLLGLWRVWRNRKVWFGVTALIAILGFGAFDWFVVVKPQRGKVFQDLLVEGYHLTNECQSIPGDTQIPAWIRDQSKAWQSRSQQLIGERLNATDAQTWQSAIVIGTVNDEGMNAYQCLWLANKIAALESIVAAEFEPNLKHRDKIGPTYWLNAVNGEVDMTQLLKSGMQNASVFINGGGKNNPSGMVRVKGNAPFKNGTVNFQLQPPP
jgi:hypothetical protein